MLKANRTTTRLIIAGSLLLISLLGLSACGQKGELYLPGESQASAATYPTISYS